MTTRPLEFNQETADVICERIANGESVRGICASNEMPAMSTVFKWLSRVDAFAEQYGRAREVQADGFFDDINDIANTPVIGKKTKYDKDGNVVEVLEGDMIEHRRLQIDARKWMAGKLRPKVYGDKLDVDLNGKLDFVISAKPVTEEEWLREHGPKT